MFVKKDIFGSQNALFGFGCLAHPDYRRIAGIASMSLLYAVVSRGDTVLAKYASCAGNFNEVVTQVLSRISAETTRLTYSHGR